MIEKRNAATLEQLFLAEPLAVWSIISDSTAGSKIDVAWLTARFAEEVDGRVIEAILADNPPDQQLVASLVSKARGESIENLVQSLSWLENETLFLAMLDLHQFTFSSERIAKQLEAIDANENSIGMGV